MKRNLVTGIILWIALVGCISGVYASYKYQASEIKYKEGNVDDAINELYAIASSKFLDRMYPVGSVYISTSLSTIEQVHDALGRTWESYGSGRTLVGVGTGTDSNNKSQSFSANSTGWEYTHTLTVNEMPSHKHSLQFSANSALGGCGASIPMTNCTGSSTPWYEYNIAATGGDQPHNILQPYITVYMYKRVS